MTFEEYQAGVRANDRMHCEADIYWRVNRWKQEQEMTERYRPFFKSNKSNPPEVGRIFRR